MNMSSTFCLRVGVPVSRKYKVIIQNIYVPPESITVVDTSDFVIEPEDIRRQQQA